MKDSNRPAEHDRSVNLAERLETEAQKIHAARDSGLVAQVMRNVRAAPRSAGIPASESNVGWLPWLMAGATAAAAVAVAITVTSVMEDSPRTNLPRHADLPRIVESRVDPVLTSREQDLTGELQRIRADLDSIGRMVSIRLETD